MHTSFPDFVFKRHLGLQLVSTLTGQRGSMGHMK